MGSRTVWGVPVTTLGLTMTIVCNECGEELVKKFVADTQIIYLIELRLDQHRCPPKATTPEDAPDDRE